MLSGVVLSDAGVVNADWAYYSCNQQEEEAGGVRGGLAGAKTCCCTGTEQGSSRAYKLQPPKEGCYSRIQVRGPSSRPPSIALLGCTREAAMMITASTGARQRVRSHSESTYIAASRSLLDEGQHVRHCLCQRRLYSDLTSLPVQ